MEIQQSSLYADYIRSLGWIVESLDNQYIFIKPFPIIGGLAKIQRVTRLPNKAHLLPMLKKYNVRTIAIEPDMAISQKDFTRWCRQLRRHIRLNHDPFIPTKTIRVDVTASQEQIFHTLSEAKRRAVRRAEKNNITITRSTDIKMFIALKNKSAGFLGFITTQGVEKLWHKLPVSDKAILLAYSPASSTDPVAGLFLFFWRRIAYYWVAGATREGKRLFAPTLLVWEALKEAKNHDCKSLDFVGVWDERKPESNKEWKGFTKFKEGFGGSALYYPII